ncbi:MAG: FadR family transcriptional regulator [Aquitalea sp.]|nr:FadR family transcriptional regulator [Aquitalea sp.]
MTDYNDFQPRHIYEQVAEQIRSSIRAGEFPPDSRLPAERELATRFRVSRPAVREAIGALQNQGLVQTRRGSGSYVCSDVFERLLQLQQNTDSPTALTDDSPIATLEARMLLEPAIARLAARRAKRSPEAEHYLAQMKNVQNIDEAAQQALWSESDRLFHRQLAVMTGDGLMVRIADEIAKTMEQQLWQRLRDDAIHDAARIHLYVAEHQMIYEAIVEGNEDAAAFYVEQHLKRVERDMTANEMPSRDAGGGLTNTTTG